jgi:hypothetical protein
MSIRARVPAQQQEVQRTQASSFYEGLVDRLKGQQALRVPRSQAAWSAEENRLGSWNTGVGRVYASGAGRSYTSGQGTPAPGDFDPDEVVQEQEKPR